MSNPAADLLNRVCSCSSSMYQNDPPAVSLCTNSNPLYKNVPKRRVSTPIPFPLQPRVVSLEFAARVIHRFATARLSGRPGAPDIPPDPRDARSRTRRLYDVSNILMNLKRPLLEKVRVLHFSSANRTFLRYVGPLDFETHLLTEEDVLSLPDYRRKHLFFGLGKKMLGIPERPTHVPDTKTVRLEEGEDGAWVPIDCGGDRGGEAAGSGGRRGRGRGMRASAALQPYRMTFADLTRPLSPEDIVALETERMLNMLRGSSEQKSRFVRQLSAPAPQAAAGGNKDSSLSSASAAAGSAAAGSAAASSPQDDSKIISLYGGCFVRVTVSE